MAESTTNRSIVFLVSGNEVPAEVTSRPLRELVSDALTSRGYTLDGPALWEVRFENGVRIDDLARSADTFGFPDGSLVFVTPEIGANG